jgi:hypothetical protein
VSHEAVGWVFRHSPYKGTKLLVHLAIADVVNDTYDNRLWMALGSLAEKLRCARQTVYAAVGEMVADGYLEEIAAPHFGGSDRAWPATYRFLFPDVDVVWDSRSEPGVTTDDTGEPGVKSTGSPVSVLRAPGVTRDDTNPREPKKNPTRAPKRRTTIPDPFRLEESDFAWAKKNAPSVDVEHTTKEFVTYWRGRGDVMANWKQTWRNRMLQVEQRSAKQGAARTYL